MTETPEARLLRYRSENQTLLEQIRGKQTEVNTLEGQLRTLRLQRLHRTIGIELAERLPGATMVEFTYSTESEYNDEGGTYDYCSGSVRGLRIDGIWVDTDDDSVVLSNDFNQVFMRIEDWMSDYEIQDLIQEYEGTVVWTPYGITKLDYGQRGRDLEPEFNR